MGMEGMMDNSVTTAFLQCRTVRIGSYKVVPREPVVISPHGIRISVPCVDDETECIPVTLDMKEIVKALIYFGRGRGIPVIFLYTEPYVGPRLRTTLNMTDSQRAYFDPMSSGSSGEHAVWPADETQRWITLLPEVLQDETKSALKSIFGSLDNVLNELDKEKANDILVKTSPKVAVNALSGCMWCWWK